MQRVEIYKLAENGSQQVVAVCRLENNIVVCEGNIRLVKQLHNNGILDRRVKPPQKVFPNDGRRFLESLGGHFKSGYLTTSPVIRD